VLGPRGSGRPARRRFLSRFPWRSLRVAIHFATEQCCVIGLTAWSPFVHPSRIAAPRAALLALVLVACAGDASTRDSTAATSPTAGGAPLVAGTALAAPHIGPAGEWQTPAGDYASSRYSELAQITA